VKKTAKTHLLLLVVLFASIKKAAGTIFIKD
jgi:hypothetical protein